MQTRLSQNSFSNPFSSQPETTASVAAPTPQVERRELPQYARPQSQYQSSALPPPIAAPQSYPPPRRRIRRRARGRVLFSAEPSADRNHRQRGAALDRRDPCTGARSRHHHYRRHQRHAGNAVAPLQRFVHRDPAGQRLQGPARVAARPAADHSAPDRDRRGARACAGAAEGLPLPLRPSSAPPSVHVVNRGDTLMSIAHRNRVPVAELAKVNSLDPNAKLKLGQKINVPGAKSAAAPAAAPPAQVAGAQPGAVAAPATKMAAVAPNPARKRRGWPRRRRRPKLPLPLLKRR